MFGQVFKVWALILADTIKHLYVLGLSWNAMLETQANVGAVSMCVVKLIVSEFAIKVVKVKSHSLSERSGN